MSRLTSKLTSIDRRPLQLVYVPLEAARAWTLGEITHAQLLASGAGPVLLINEFWGPWSWPEFVAAAEHGLPPLVIFYTKCPGLIRLAKRLGAVPGWGDGEGHRWVMDSEAIRRVLARLRRICDGQGNPVEAMKV